MTVAETGVKESVAEIPKKHNSYLSDQDDVERVQAVQPKEAVHEQIIAAELPIDRNIVAIREELERERREKEELKANFEIWKASLQKQNIPEPQMQKNPIEELEQEDALPVGVYKHQEQEWNNRQKQMQNEIAELRMAIKYPDYKEVLDEYAAPLIKEKPHLAAGFYAAQDPWQYAYEIGSLAKRGRQAVAPTQPAPPQVSRNAERMVENSRKPGSLSAVGGQGSFHAVKDYANMSDEEFDAEVQRVQRDM